MCGRFTLTTPDLDALARSFGAAVAEESARLHRPRWNIAPTQTSIILVDEGGRRLVRARFGAEVPGGRFVLNARSETAAALRTFRNAFAHARCVVPADGFYEWRGSRRDRTPVWFHAPSGGPLLFAALALEHHGEKRFVILTTAANERIRPLHDRMPVLLSREGALAWLERPDPGLLVPAPAEALAGRDASPLVNDVANDGPELLEAPPPPRQLRLV